MRHVNSPIGQPLDWHSELTTMERLLLGTAESSLTWFLPIGGATSKRSIALPVWDKTKAIAVLKAKVIPPYGIGRCAAFTSAAIESGGLTLPRPESSLAKDYGPGLQSIGFLPLVQDPKVYVAGDVVVIDRCTGHESGHMAMFADGEWYSDFEQKNGLYPHHTYEDQRTPYVIYRYSGTTK